MMLEPYTGPIEPGMVFDFEPGKKHKYERLTVTKKVGPQLWATGRCGQTFHQEPDFRKSVLLVSEKPIQKPLQAPVQKLEKRYDGPLAIGMVFDFEPGKRHQYERITIVEMKGDALWARGRAGMTYHDANEFRDHVVPVPQV